LIHLPNEHILPVLITGGTVKHDGMKIVIVAATAFEIDPLKQYLNNVTSSLQDGCDTSFVVTGVGMMAATYALAKYLAAHTPDWVIQAGIAGSFTEEFPPGDVTIVGEEAMGDLGVMEKDGYKDMFDLGLVSRAELPFTDSRLINPWLEHWNFLQLPVARGITVNEITTGPERTALLKKKYNCDVESMEGAALHYVCLQEKVRFVQVRSISNYIGDRDKSNWKLTASISNLNNQLIRMIQKLHNYETDPRIFSLPE
jgi:futalosine hydrolase